MLLTKDNVLKFLREKKYVTPTTISENFETSTMIGSAALSELSKDKLVAITNLKIGSSPYYYDPNQKSCLIELGEKHFSNFEKEAFNLLKENQVLNDASLSIQLKVAIEKIKDFALPLEIDYQNKKLKFWIWYLRDLKETEKQIKEAINGQTQKPNNSQENRDTKTSEKIKTQVQKTLPKEIQEKPDSKKLFENKKENIEESKTEIFIEDYFIKNYLKIDNKNKKEKQIKYSLTLTVNKIKIILEAIYFVKKPTDEEIIKFYISSNKPKLIFIENTPKKFFKLINSLENCELINI